MAIEVTHRDVVGVYEWDAEDKVFYGLYEGPLGIICSYAHRIEDIPEDWAEAVDCHLGWDGEDE